MNTSSITTLLITGGTGLIGSRFAELLPKEKFRVIFLSRRPTGGNYFHWDPEKNLIDETAIRQADIIINLAGTPIAEKRWNSKRKEQIIKSRVDGTNLLAETLRRVPNNLKLVIQASAIGFYGDTGSKLVDENTNPESGFLGITTSKWETAAQQFENLGIRTVIFRIGILLSTKGGALPEMLKPMSFGMETIFGSGNQIQSWIHIDDLCAMFLKAIEDQKLSGVYNGVAPNPVTNEQLMDAIKKAGNGSAFKIHVPAWLLNLMLGEMSVVILSGSKVSAQKIIATGFNFQYPDIDNALKNLLGK